MNRDQAKAEVEDVLDRREPRYYDLDPEEKQLVEIILQKERLFGQRAERVQKAINDQCHALVYTSVHVEKLCAIIEKLSR